MSLIERKQAEAEELDQLVLRALERLSNPASGSEVASLVDRSERTVRRSLTRLEAARFGARQGERGGFVITAAGRDRALGEVPGAASGEQLDALLVLLPTTAHRAFVRLGLAAVAGRHLLHPHESDSWPTFVGMGDTGQGKGTSGTILVCAYGVDENEALPDTSTLVPGEIFGRRFIPRGGQRMTFEPSSRLSLPVLVLNEWDKNEEIRRESLKLVLGRSRQRVEGVLVESRPLVVVTMNVDQKRLGKHLPDEVLRRSVVLNTREVMTSALTEQLEDRFPEIRSQARRLRFRVEALRLGATTLPPDVDEALRRWVRSGLTEQGRGLVQIEALRRIVLGRAALLQSDDYRRAAAVVALDFLHTRATLGHTVRDYWQALHEELGADPDRLAEAKASQAELESVRGRRENKTARVRLKLVEQRAIRHARIVAARDPLKQTRDGFKAATRDVLTEYARTVKGSSTAEELEGHWEVVEPYLVQAEGWLNADKQRAELDGKQKEREALRRQDQQTTRQGARRAEADRRRREAAARVEARRREKAEKDDAAKSAKGWAILSASFARVHRLTSGQPPRKPRQGRR